MTRTILCVMPVWLALACTGDDKGASDTASPTDDTGTPAADPAEHGMPEGESEWTGTAEVSGFTFLFDLSLDNDGGDLSGTATFADDPDAPLGVGVGVYTVTGTHEPGSGLVAIAAEDWVEEPDLAVELVGFLGTYDPDTGTLSGTAQDYASGADNSLTGGPAELTLASGAGAALDHGDGGAALPEGTRSFSGTHQCTGDEREAAGELTYDGEGGVSGSLSFGDLTLAESTHTFEFTGVHNPSTGGVTLVPGLYTETDASFATFFVEATYDPATDSLAGEGRINVGSCPADLFQVSF